jgi:hypothetical protein
MYFIELGLLIILYIQNEKAFALSSRDSDSGGAWAAARVSL